MYGLGLIALGMAGYYGLQFAEAKSATNELARFEAEYKKLTPQAEAAVKLETELSATIKTSENLTKRIEGRCTASQVAAASAASFLPRAPLMR